MNQILCVASWPGVPSVAPCKQRDVHLETCVNDECRGCFPRPAERGFLCASHFDRVEHALMRWDEWSERAKSLGLSRAVQRDNAGVRSTAEGHVNLTLRFLAENEAEGFLSVGHQSVEMWVSTEAGATDAIQFAAAAERAFLSVEVVERPHRIRRVRCECGAQLIWKPPAWFEGDVSVNCTVCDRRLTQDEFEALEVA